MNLIKTILLLSLLFGMQNTIKGLSRNPKNNLKSTFLSFYTGSAKLTYERYLFNKQSIEITTGIIGVINDPKRINPKGGLVRLAYKFIFNNQENGFLTGFYIKPEVAYSSYAIDNQEQTLPTRLNINRVALMGCGGYQWAKQWLTLDAFVGAGIGIGNTFGSNYHHGFIGFSAEDVSAFTFGLKIGIAF